MPLGTSATCPIVHAFLSSLERTLSEREMARLVERWTEALSQVSDDATQRRAAFLTDRTLRKYSTEAMEALHITGAAKHLTRVPDRDTARELTNQIAAYLFEEVRKDPNSPHNDRLRHAAQVCSRTSQAIAAYPDNPAETARCSAQALTSWSASAGTGIIHELHTILREMSEIT